MTGEYVPYDFDMYDPGVIEGVLSEDGMTFSGKWIESGSFIDTLADDNMSFTANGSSNPVATMTQPYSFTFIAQRSGDIDPENLWNGSWSTDRKIYEFIQNGTAVTGVNQPLPGVDDESGIMEGTVSEDGRTISGTWTETGLLVFVISDDGTSINATINESLDPASIADIVTFTKVI